MARVNDCADDEVDEFSLPQWHLIELTDLNSTSCRIPCPLTRDVRIQIRATCRNSVDTSHSEIIRDCELNARVGPQRILNLNAESKGARLID